ncbi:MAG: hypothetical protein EOL97_07810 [Spirochaetia bacterium]|nr:hypothetical protein [Spirochaetia bacterium]
MTYKEVEKILTESKKEDWLNFVDRGKPECTYKKDLNLRIKKDESTEKEDETVLGTGKSDKKYFSCWYDVYYKKSLVERVKLLDYNKGDFIIPFTIENYNSVKKMDTHIARIINQKSDVDLVLNELKLIISDN